MFMIPDLLYEYSELEPFIDKETMKIHHDKHHGGYVEKLNVALTGYDRFLSMDIETLIKSIDDIPDNIRPKVINQGGGHVNHSLFWTIMGPNEKVVKFSPNGNFKYAIETTFNDLPTFIDKFSESATDIFGSGWSFLVINNQKLEIISKQNQDSPLMKGDRPILGLDVWEHAYYLKYQNKRGDYLSNWWNVVNWKKV